MVARGAFETGVESEGGVFTVGGFEESGALDAPCAAETAISRVDRYTSGAAALVRAKESEGGTLSFQFETKSGRSIFNGEV